MPLLSGLLTEIFAGFLKVLMQSNPWVIGGCVMFMIAMIMLGVK